MRRADRRAANMTGNNNVRLPGRRERPSDWTPTSTTPARSWAELIETIQGGLAVLDDQWRLAYVSDRFLTSLGEPDDLVGDDIRRLLPALTEDDPRGLLRQVERGSRIEFEQQFPIDDGDRCWYRLTVVPSAGLGEGLAAVVFAKDITTTSRTLALLRDATVGLTEVESELHRRVGRDVHDGPIQLLAALMFRLGMSKSDEANELQRVVSEVASTLRTVIEDFSPAQQRAQGTLLEQWIAPLLAGSGVDVKVEDRRAAESSLAQVQAAFVLVYQTFRAMRDPAVRRTLDVVLSDEHGGERIVLTVRSMESALVTGHRAAQLRAITDHARALGGTLSTWLGDDNVRTVSMWTPRLTEPTEPPDQVSTSSERAPRLRLPNEVSLLPQLRDSTWRDIANAAPERIVEFDDQVRVSFSNAAQQESIGVSPDQLLGLSIESMFTAESLPHLADVFDRLDAGEFAETDWYRENILGDKRLIHLTASPRLDEAGRWQGALVVTDDRTDVDLLDDLYQTALADLTQARHLAIEASIRRLARPLAECEQLIDHIERFERTTSDRGPVSTIKLELAAALRRIEGSTSALVTPRFAIGDLDGVLRESLGPLLAGRRLVVVDNTDSPPSPEISHDVFRIAREAVNNAVLHGKASWITVTLANTEDGFSCNIHDNGVGVDPARMQHRPGHLGTRAMRERARERGGTCRIEPDPRGGTLVSLWLPSHAGRPSLLDGVVPTS
jgi:PAS domain S-box-containing protein